MACSHLAFIKSILLSVAASRIRYEITSGNIGGAFAVKNMTGAIYVAGALDYETRKRVGIAINVIRACVSLYYVFYCTLQPFLSHTRARGVKFSLFIPRIFERIAFLGL